MKPTTTNRPRYKTSDLPALPKGIWWEEARQRFRVRLYHKGRPFRAPYFSIKSSGSIEQALQDALDAYEKIRAAIKKFDEDTRVPVNRHSAKDLIANISRSTSSVKIGSRAITNTRRRARSHWSLQARKPDRRAK